MKLLNIKAHGFKSFADKIEINVGDGITGIVGPNGSGKSNIVDAVRWVLGESSLKEIRGGETQSDVIFSGSSSRGKSTRAWVSLTFDNQDRYLACEFDTVEIKREIFASGESDYFINNTKVRKKDITDLFIDTGTSANSFSIISQGKISEILKGKGSDRRAIIEEAAGVLKYKKRKEDTLRKLKDANNNLEKVSLVIDELEISLAPLKEESIVAKEYLKNKELLSNVEVGLLANDINKLNNEEENIQTSLKKMNEELLSMDTKTNIDGTKLEGLKNKQTKLDLEISTLTDTIMNLQSELSELNSKKQVIEERGKYEVEDAKLQNNILLLKENIMNTKKELSSKKELQKQTSSNVIKQKEICDNLNDEYNNDTIKKNTLLKELSNKSKELININNKIDSLNEMLETDSKVPYQVKSVLNNPRLKGIHNTLGSLIDVKNEYTTCIDIALSQSVNIIVVDNENSAKGAIEFLNESNLGRVTFFPISIIKPREVKEADLKIALSTPGFIGVASDLVEYDALYDGIIKNQLGNTLVVSNIDAMNALGKKLDYRYRIVTLNGEIQYAGGALSGGKIKKNLNVINIKYELNNLNKEANILSNEIELMNTHLADLEKTLELTNNRLFEEKNKLFELNGELSNLQSDINNLTDMLNKFTDELSGTNDLMNKDSSKELDSIIESILKISNDKNKKTNELENLKSNKNDLSNEINELELKNKNIRSEYNKKMNDIKELEINLSKTNLKIDNALNRLNEEYNITYEKAYMSYPLDMDEEVARSKVNQLKRAIRDLGEVNTGSIKEYERISQRYEFLTTQRNDLTDSINDLLGIIDELDATMIEKFKSTFELVNQEFGVVFKKMFKGGNAYLTLTDPDDLLNTGVEIVATPPGKSLKNIYALSGGEMSLTAIALLFGILNIKTVPFCILDEVEAALDEANVDIFGSYINDVSKHHQFIVITHKKRTMEYVNNLYGVTMQESGVSKLVSVKLEGIE